MTVQENCCIQEKVQTRNIEAMKQTQKWEKTQVKTVHIIMETMEDDDEEVFE